MPRSSDFTHWPIGVYRADSARYMSLWRWLRKFDGTWVYTEEELRAALLEPRMFYMVPEEFRRTVLPTTEAPS